jgi:hypothetical protein
LSEGVPSTAAGLLQAGYTAQVRDIAPERLLGREQELTELIRFCAGEERYQWWQADPWAGKSALAAWFVLHPPAGVGVVSFLVTNPRFFTEACGVVKWWLAWCGSGELGTSDCDQHIDRSARLGVVSLGRCGIVTVLDARVAGRTAGQNPPAGGGRQDQ